jgi:hypothetical protein
MFRWCPSIQPHANSLQLKNTAKKGQQVKQQGFFFSWHGDGCVDIMGKKLVRSAKITQKATFQFLV